jgi:tetratricopeptide (TPR) repeat protein
MRKNILYSLAGVVLGFFVGFFIANINGRPRQGASAVNASAARGVDPAQAGGQLPPGHPNLSDQGSGANGAAAASSGQAQAAMDTADRNPQDFTAQITAAATFYQLESFDKAELYLTRALALKPDDPDALTGMGHTKFDTGDYLAAATYYEKILAQRPADADVRADLGSTYAQRTPPDYDRAIAEYRKALEIDPKHEQALARLADAALHKGDKATARDAIDKLAAANPSNPALSSLRSNLNGQ